MQKAVLPFFTFIILFFLLRLVFMINANLLVEEAYYWNYSTHLDFGFLDHPPMVAWVIKLGTLIFGANEWGVRFGSMLCWILTTYFSFKLTNLIQKGAGIYAVALLSALPFYFIHASIITPDVPLILSWSATLYYLFQALVLNQSQKWYLAGVWLGIGLLSKYTMVLLGLSTLVYLIVEPSSRKWFIQKEIYLSLLIGLILFSPVIYWNATHEWASFLFQSTRRFHDYYSFSFHELIGLMLVFLTPAGVFGGWVLFSRKHCSQLQIPIKTKCFLRVYTIIPLVFFSLFSFCHGIKVNWIGPSVLAIIPWLAILIFNNQKIIGITSHNSWLLTFIVSFFCYSGLIYCILFNYPRNLHHLLFQPLVSWANVTRQIHDIAYKLDIKNHDAPIIVPLDAYNIGSEFLFYQQKLLDNQQINTTYKVIGSHIFGLNSLMYQYWGNVKETDNKVLILISHKPDDFDSSEVKDSIVPLSPIKTVIYQDHGDKWGFYYKIARIKV